MGSGISLEIKTIVILAIFMFLEGVFLSLAFSDISSSGLNLTSSSFNLTGNPTNNDMGGSGIGKALSTMFAFHVSESDFPAMFAAFISFFNWLIFVVVGICVYRIVNPFS